MDLAPRAEKFEIFSARGGETCVLPANFLIRNEASILYLLAMVDGASKGKVGRGKRIIRISGM